MSQESLAPSPHQTDTWQGCWRQLLDTMHVVKHEPELEAQLFERLLHPTAPTILAFVNAHAMNCVVGNQRFGEALAGADILVRDGSGMSLLMRLLGRHPGVNLNGTDLIPQLLERYAGRSVALYGTTEPYLGKAARFIQRDYAHGSPISRMHGFGSPPDYLERALQDQPELIVLGMGMPKQENTAAFLRNHLQHPCLIVCGGAIIDFMGDRFDRAPPWMRKTGLEWLYRLSREPKRLFKRYVIGNPMFVARSLMLKFQ